MKNFFNQSKNHENRSISNDSIQKKNNQVNSFQDNSEEAIQMRQFQNGIDNSEETTQMKTFNEGANNNEVSQLKKKSAQNNTGIPDQLKSKMENFSGYSLDDVNVHYNSEQPAQLKAHAFAQGTEVHIAAGQEKHLPHELGHVIQQKQGFVKSTREENGQKINDDVSLEKGADQIAQKAAQTPVRDASLKDNSIDKPVSQQKVVQKEEDMAAYNMRMNREKQKAINQDEMDNGLGDSFYNNQEVRKDRQENDPESEKFRELMSTSVKYCEEVDKLVDLINARSDAQKVLNQAKVVVAAEAAMGITLGILGLTNPFSAPVTLAVIIIGAIAKSTVGGIADSMVDDVTNNSKLKGAGKGLAKGGLLEGGKQGGKELGTELLGDGLSGANQAGNLSEDMLKDSAQAGGEGSMGVVSDALPVGGMLLSAGMAYKKTSKIQGLKDELWVPTLNKSKNDQLLYNTTKEVANYHIQNKDKISADMMSFWPLVQTKIMTTADKIKAVGK